MERILIFANRHSGAFNRVARRAPLAHFARQAGLEPEIIRTQSPSHLYRLLKERVVGKERKVAIAGGTTKSLLRTLRAALHLWLAHRPLTLDIMMDGKQTTEKAVMVADANSFRIGLALPIAPNARLTDDELDVVIMGPLTRREMIQYYHAVRAQSHTELPKVSVTRSREIRIESPDTLNVHVDDRVRKRTPVTMRLVPNALRVMVDRL